MNNNTVKIENNFFIRIHNESYAFLTNIFKAIDRLGLVFDKKQIDHLCYRVKTEDEYNCYSKRFLECGILLAENIVGGRLISTFKLYSPIRYEGHQITVIELPAPKPCKVYNTGFEHVEFVIEQTFEEVIKTNPTIYFDTTGINKKHNPELRVKLASGKSFKLHHDSLENIIRIEKSRIST